MAKGKGDAGASAGGDRPKERRRAVRRLESELAAIRATEARRAAQLAKAQAREAKVVATLDQLRSTPAPVKGVAAAAGGEEPVTAAAAAAGDGAGPSAYCLREKRSVTMRLPAVVTLRNGRRALTGACPSCGAHLVRMIGADTQSAATGAAPTEGEG
ncbi:MAG TPA: DUF5679 domain-containing protein [Candidatus Limnocylindrales bacterium]